MSINDQRDWMWSEACALLARAERLNQQFFQPGLRTEVATWEPPVDVLETELAIWIIVALPGVETSDLQISLEADVLRIVGVRRLPIMARGSAVHRLEIPNGRFERRIRLPAAPLEIGRPELKDGCLYLCLTKQG